MKRYPQESFDAIADPYSMTIIVRCPNWSRSFDVVTPYGNLYKSIDTFDHKQFIRMVYPIYLDFVAEREKAIDLYRQG